MITFCQISSIGYAFLFFVCDVCSEAKPPEFPSWLYDESAKGETLALIRILNVKTSGEKMGEQIVCEAEWVSGIGSSSENTGRLVFEKVPDPAKSIAKQQYWLINASKENASPKRCYLVPPDQKPVLVEYFNQTNKYFSLQEHDQIVVAWKSLKDDGSGIQWGSFAMAFIYQTRHSLDPISDSQFETLTALAINDKFSKNTRMLAVRLLIRSIGEGNVASNRLKLDILSDLAINNRQMEISCQVFEGLLNISKKIGELEFAKQLSYKVLNGKNQEARCLALRFLSANDKETIKKEIEKWLLDPGVRVDGKLKSCALECAKAVDMRESVDLVREYLDDEDVQTRINAIDMLSLWGDELSRKGFLDAAQSENILLQMVGRTALERLEKKKGREE